MENQPAYLKPESTSRKVSIHSELDQFHSLKNELDELKNVLQDAHYKIYGAGWGSSEIEDGVKPPIKEISIFEKIEIIRVTLTKTTQECTKIANKISQAIE